jgi:hypothetical protein
MWHVIGHQVGQRPETVFHEQRRCTGREFAMLQVRRHLNQLVGRGLEARCEGGSQWRPCTG